MRVIRVGRRPSRAALAAAAEIIRAGGVVAFPTETAYGLAADPRQPAAVRKIFLIKGRRREKQLPLIAASPVAAVKIARLADPARRLARRHWPGPLTLVLPARRSSRLAGFTGRNPTVAVRVPAFAWARALAAVAGGLVTSTSANISGRPVLYSGTAVRRELTGRRHEPDLLLDAGRLPRRSPSTVVSFNNGQPKILRQGSIRVV